jgi:hypothetical protein
MLKQYLLRFKVQEMQIRLQLYCLLQLHANAMRELQEQRIHQQDHWLVRSLPEELHFMFP